MINTTCWMGVGSPGRSGTGCAATLRRGASAAVFPPADPAGVRRLFCATAVEYAASACGVGIATTLTDPRTACTNRPRRPGDPSVWPLPEPTPSSAPMASDFPSGERSRLDGYHAVGIMPDNRHPGVVAVAFVTL